MSDMYYINVIEINVLLLEKRALFLLRDGKKKALAMMVKNFKTSITVFFVIILDLT